MKNNIRVERAILRMTQQQIETIKDYTRKIAKEMHVVGLMNMQYAIENGKFIPSTELALKLSAYFGKTVNDIFSLD